MQLRHFKTNTQLQHLIKGYWLLDTQAGGNSNQVNTIFPDGAIEIIFHFKNPFLRINLDKCVPEEYVFIEGQQSGRLKVKQQGSMKTIGITLYPWASRYFYKVMPAVFTDTSFRADTVDHSINQLYNSLALNIDYSLIPELCDNYFLARLSKTKNWLGDADRLVINLINRPAIDFTIEELKKDWAFSNRYFEQKCLQLTGISPIDLLKKRRMKKALDKCLNTGFKSFTDVAHSCGFYDQSHFIKDFKYYFNQPPREVFRDKNFFLESFL